MRKQLLTVYRHTVSVDGWQCSDCHIQHFHGRRPRRGFVTLVGHKVLRHHHLPRQERTITMFDPEHGRFRWEFNAPPC